MNIALLSILLFSADPMIGINEYNNLLFHKGIYIDSFGIGGSLSYDTIVQLKRFGSFFMLRLKNDSKFWIRNDSSMVGGGITAAECHDSCNMVRGEIPTLTWTNITDKPTTFPPEGHNQSWSTITSQPTIPSPYDSSFVTGACAWNSVSSKPSTYPPESHSQAISTITNLMDSLGIKLPLHNKADSSKQGDSLGHKSPAYYTDTTRFKADSTALANHSHSGLAPTAGASGYVLKKNSATNYDYSWAVDATGGGSYNPGIPIEWHTVEPHDAVTKYACATAFRAWFTPTFVPCSLIVNKIMFRGRIGKGSDYGIYDSLGAKLYSTGYVSAAQSALCSLMVSPTLRLGPAQYYVAWACSSATVDTVCGIAQAVAGMVRRNGYINTSCPLPTSVTLNNIVLDVRYLWFNLRRY